VRTAGTPAWPRDSTRGQGFETFGGDAVFDTHRRRVEAAVGSSEYEGRRDPPAAGTDVLYSRTDNQCLRMPNSNGPQQGTRHKLQNDARERGTSPPQRAIQQFEPGDTVHLRLDPSVQEGRFHPRFNGETGSVLGQQGQAYRVEITDGGVEKTVITRPVHLTEQS
jgi:large subunit ribosomal protein L21e